MLSFREPNDGHRNVRRSALTLMIGGASKRKSGDRPLFCSFVPYGRHPKAMELQVEIEEVVRKFCEVRCQPQTLKLVLSVVLGIRHACLFGKADCRTHA